MTLRLSEEEYAELMRRWGKADAIHGVPTGATGDQGIAPTGRRGKKYGNVRVEIDGKKFDSKHEAEVYGELMLRLRAGELKLVLRQVPFELPGGIKYIADFVTMDHENHIEVIDAKSPATRKNRVYINKKKQMLSEWGIEVREM